jgi:protein involved in polysaccharide export with SLBB domain
VSSRIAKAILAAGMVVSISVPIIGCSAARREQLPPASAYRYQVGSGDTLKVNVYREQQLTGEYTVSGSGNITLPLVGDVKVAGGGLEEARAAIVAALARQYVDPQVTVETIKFRPVFILGEVNQPGEYDYRERMTVVSLVAKAGGFRFRANKKVAWIRHQDEDAEAAYALTSGAVLQPGDVVRIGATII